MLQKWLILIPELSMLAYLIVAAFVNVYREEKTAKTFFTLGKYFIFVSMFFSIIFYNKSVFPDIWQNTSYTVLFKITIYLIAFVWFYLSSKYFLSKNRSSYAYYSLGMLFLLLFSILLSSQSLMVPAIIIPCLCILTWLIFHLFLSAEETIAASRKYIVFAGLFCIILWCGIFILWKQTGSLEYFAIKNFLIHNNPLSSQIIMAIFFILASLLFMMAAAPFHFCFVGIISVSILPVAGFLTVIPPFVYLSCLISLVFGVFSPLEDILRPFLLSFALFSIIIGSVSANSQKRLRDLFAFSSVYNLGVMLLGLISFSHGSISGSFAFTVIYVLSMLGVYTIFLGIKLRGDYTDSLEELNGMSSSKPYLSSALLILMTSLMGIPPLLGFLGRLSVFNNLIIQDQWSSIIILTFCMLFMANAYVQVIKTIYFESPKQKFDRTGKAIYTCLFFNLILVFLSILNPGYWLNDAEIILNGVFG